ncbi:hypothetical protein CLORY_05610 [Clostridium oryzae]|uniref:Uncharacterized protein n=1 Tax=Clostridium oryzae TaxID=1450648 RepID=A0A1V4IYA1_9CLOT|nr:hypothetical protein CLORY_05610 [Clostridium oryzae]
MKADIRWLTIELNISDNLIMYLSNGGESNSDGTEGDSPF